MKIFHSLLLLLVTIATGSATTTNKFAIYLTAEPVDPAILSNGKGDWKTIQLAEAPLFTEADIVSYDFTDHVVRFRPGSIERIPPPSVSGIPFVVIANGEKIYLGVFMTCLSSFSRAVPSIVVDELAVSFECGPRTELRISRSYPTQTTNDAPDPRSDARIKEALRHQLE